MYNFFRYIKKLKKFLLLGGRSSRNTLDFSVAVMPLRRVFTILFQKTRFLFETISYIENLENRDRGVTYNLIQCSLWKEKTNAQFLQPTDLEVLYLPLLVYFDQFEPANVLGSHAGLKRIGGIYIKIPCIPEYCICNLNYHIYL